MAKESPEKLLLNCSIRDDRIGKGSVRGASKSERMMELEERRRERKKKRKRALSAGEAVILLSYRKSEGKFERHKLLEMILARDQKDPSVDEGEALSRFLWLKKDFPHTGSDSGWRCMRNES